VAALALITVAVVTRPASSASEAPEAAWSVPMPIATRLVQAALPSLAYTPDGTAHAIWESNGGLYYAYQTPNRPWSKSVRVAAGLSPSMVVDKAGNLEAVFANQFAGNYEIYHIRRRGGKWSLPVNVSHTSGYSGRPVLAAAEDGTLHAAWMDNTPGFWIIYYGTWAGTFWSSQPVPNARGQAPSLAASPAGTIFLAWQDKVPTKANPNGEYDVLVSELTAGIWTLPSNVSDSPGVDSLGVSVTAPQDEAAHTTWVEQSERIQYSYGRDIYWSEPQLVCQVSSPAHTPRIIADTRGYLNIAWDQTETIWMTRANPWPAGWPTPIIVASLTGSLRDVTMALPPAGGPTIGWVQASGPGEYGVYSAWQGSAVVQRVWLPVLMR